MFELMGAYATQQRKTRHWQGTKPQTWQSSRKTAEARDRQQKQHRQQNLRTDNRSLGKVSGVLPQRSQFLLKAWRLTMARIVLVAVDPRETLQEKRV